MGTEPTARVGRSVRLGAEVEGVRVLAVSEVLVAPAGAGADETLITSRPDRVIPSLTSAGLPPCKPAPVRQGSTSLFKYVSFDTHDADEACIVF